MKKNKVGLVNIECQFITVQPSFYFTKFSVDGFGGSWSGGEIGCGNAGGW